MDEAKHMALLFFMDHLMQKNGCRTIHDLSCQFGAREFTAEMREAVGTTQEGLTDFLNQHPSLFTVEGDQVSLNGYGELTAKNNPLLQGSPNGRNRDYVKEAVQFFETKLHKFGPELQIKSLLGHRSQAAPEVRLVSGRHLKDFCEFLQTQTEYFIVEGDRVRLKNMPEPSIAELDLDEQGKPLSGAKAKQAAVDFLRSTLEANEDHPMPLDVFYQKFCDRFSHTIRQEVATNPKELLQFLKLNRNIFFIRSNRVSLVRNRTSDNGSECGSTEGSELENTINNNGVTKCGNKRVINLVKSLKVAQEAVIALTAEIDTMDEKIIGIDFKTVTLGTQGYEFLSLIVVATTTQIHVFDVVHSDTVFLESGIKELCESETIIKVIHDAKRISTLLAHRYAVNLRKVFDTQVAHMLLQQEKFGKLFTDIRTVSFMNLQRVYYPQYIMMTDLTPRKLAQTQNWGQRPLTEEFLSNAVEEAFCSVSALYRILNDFMPNHLRALFEERCLQVLIPAANRPPPTFNNNNNGTKLLNRAPGRNLYTASPPMIDTSSSAFSSGKSSKKTCDISTQTFSTGEINVLNVYYDN